MSQILKCALAVGLLTANACTTDLPTAADDLSPNLRAEVETLFQGWFPLNPPPTGVWNACTGEYVLVSGDFHLIVRRVTASSGHVTFRVLSHANVTGIGATTGMEYVSNEVLNLTRTGSPDGAAVFQLEFRINTISKGSAPNAAGYMRLHMTVNAQGEVTAERQEFVFDICRG